MGIAFDAAPDRPEHIDAILNGLDRYNPETTTVFQDYVTQQCEDRTYDCYANLALLKLYVNIYTFLTYKLDVCDLSGLSREMMMMKEQLRFLLPEASQVYSLESAPLAS